MFVCVLVCSGITLERLDRFRPNLVHTLLYVQESYIYIPQGGWCGRQGIWMIHIVEIKLSLLLGNRVVMTSRLATVGQAYPRKHIVSAKM
jgi:hypothetical protein